MPTQLDLKSRNKSKAQKNFLQKWKNYETASDLNGKSDEKRTAILLTLIGDDALTVYNTFQWDDPSNSKKIDLVIQKFEEYCNPRQNIAYERYLFNSRQQHKFESMEEYLTQLRILAISCEFGRLEDSLIRDRIICA